MKKIIILLCIPFFFLRCDSFLDVNPDSEVVNDDMFNSASVLRMPSMACT